MPLADPVPRSRPTLKDIARRAGMSISGASRALSGDPAMAEATRLRVREIARELGYEPMAAARALRDCQRGGAASPFLGTIGHLLYRHEIEMMRHPEAATRFSWIFEVGRRAASHGYAADILEIDETDPAAGRRLSAILRARGIGGVIISAKHNDVSALGLDWDRLSAVSLNAEPTGRFLSNLSVPYYQDTFFAVQEVYRRGYRRPGFIMVGNVLDEFCSGYQSAVHKLGLPVIRPLVAERGVPRQLESWLTRHRIDCIVTTTGLEMLRAVEATGRSVPGDMGICFVDDFDAPGRLSGLHQPRVKLGQLAVDILHTMLRHNEKGPPPDPLEVHLPSAWSEGETLRPR